MTLRQEINNLFRQVQQIIIDDARAKQALVSQLSDAISKYTPDGERETMKQLVFDHLDKLGLHAANADAITLDELMTRANQRDDNVWEDIDIKISQKF